MVLLASYLAASAQAPGPIAEDSKLRVLSSKWYLQTVMQPFSSSALASADMSKPSSDFGNSEIYRISSNKFFLYEVKFKNETGSKIKSISFDYIFSDLDSNKELQRHSFVSRDAIGKNKKVTIDKPSPAPPTSLVSAAGLGKDPRSPYNERVEVTCILFSDGTMWETKNKPGSPCSDLERRLRQRYGRR